MYKIQKNISMPPARPGRRAHTYPFADMDVGDSFKVSPAKTKTAQQYAYAFGKKNKQKFAARRVAGGTRIWRVK